MTLPTRFNTTCNTWCIMHVLKENGRKAQQSNHIYIFGKNIPRQNDIGYRHFCRELLQLCLITRCISVSFPHIRRCSVLTSCFLLSRLSFTQRREKAARNRSKGALLCTLAAQGWQKEIFISLHPPPAHPESIDRRWANWDSEGELLHGEYKSESVTDWKLNATVPVNGVKRQLLRR